MAVVVVGWLDTVQVRNSGKTKIGTTVSQIRDGLI